MLKGELSEFTPNSLFLREVEEVSGEKVSSCYQCQKCSSGCPVAFAMDFLPHMIIHMVQLGLKEQVLKSSTIWVCASCETCTTRCPNEIDIAGVMDTLRRMAIASRVTPGEKDIPKFHLAFLGSIKGGGRVHELGMLARYMLKADFWSKLKSGELLDEAKIGWEMFKRGKFKILPHKMPRAKEIKKLFEQGKR